jgi:dTDP-4-dehydrorhamnose 3,5-epimerase
MGAVSGVEVRPLRILRDARGAVMHMLRADAPHFAQFGEVYFSVILKGAIKAWKRHRLVTQNLAVPLGSVRIVVYDDRTGSATRDAVQEIVTGPEHYALITIPPLLWYGFQGLAEPHSLIANCASAPHDPAESEALDASALQIPFAW